MRQAHQAATRGNSAAKRTWHAKAKRVVMLQQLGGNCHANAEEEHGLYLIRPLQAHKGRPNGIPITHQLCIML